MLLPLQILGLFIVKEADEVLKHAVLRAVLVDELKLLVLFHVEVFHDGAHHEFQHRKARPDVLKLDQEDATSKHFPLLCEMQGVPS